MRRFWYAKYALTLLALTTVTFHLLHTGTNRAQDNALESTFRNDSFQLRRLSQGSQPPSEPGWVVLHGDVTVHEGRDPQNIAFDYIFPAETLCRDFDTDRKKLLLFVASSADHFARRDAIRGTWGLKVLQQALNYRVVFLLGHSEDSDTQSLVEQENYRYGDVVQANLTDSFRNLGLKSIAGLDWSQRFCGQADFIAKTDDDILVHTPNLVSSLSGRDGEDQLLLCHENRLRKILRKDMMHQDMPEDYGKYVVGEQELPGTYYPPYCSGMAYVFSRDVRDRLLQAALDTPTFFIEDVHLTGFCRHKAGVVMQLHAGITLRPPVSLHQASCVFKDGRVTSQEVEAEELRHLWAELNTRGFFCPQLLGYARNAKPI